MFDREMSEQDVRVGDLTGFKDFDPSTAAGRMRWRQLRELFETYFSHSADPAVCEMRAEGSMGSSVTDLCLRFHTK